MDDDILYRVEYPLLPYDIPEIIKARFLEFSVCSKKHAVELCRLWHSRLPNTQAGPWIYAFKMSYGGVTYAVALWNNPSARTLPRDWVELRRMACAPDAPRNTASRFLSEMIRFLKTNSNYKKAISYQDTAVHFGTIYKAANWKIGFVSAPRVRDRSKNRVNTNRLYRKNINGVEADSSSKVRWEMTLKKGGE